MEPDVPQLQRLRRRGRAGDGPVDPAGLGLALRFHPRSADAQRTMNAALGSNAHMQTPAIGGTPGVPPSDGAIADRRRYFFMRRLVPPSSPNMRVLGRKPPSSPSARVVPRPPSSPSARVLGRKPPSSPSARVVPRPPSSPSASVVGRV